MKNKATRTVVFITSNPHKADEVAAALAPYGISVIHRAIDLPEIQSADVKEVIIDKVEKAYAAVKKPVIVDDAGIYFSGYAQFPGVLSRFVSMALGFKGLTRLIDDGQKAYFSSYIAYKGSAKGGVELFSGRCNGTLTSVPRGRLKPKMPYDSLFIPNGDTRTFSEMTVEEKQQYDHRSKALRKFANYFTNL